MQKKVKSFRGYPDAVDKEIERWQKEKGPFDIILVSTAADDCKFFTQILYTEDRQSKESKLLSS